MQFRQFKVHDTHIPPCIWAPGLHEQTPFISKVVAGQLTCLKEQLPLVWTSKPSAHFAHLLLSAIWHSSQLSSTQEMHCPLVSLVGDRQSSHTRETVPEHLMQLVIWVEHSVHLDSEFRKNPSLQDRHSNARLFARQLKQFPSFKLHDEQVPPSRTCPVGHDWMQDMLSADRVNPS